MPGPGAAPHLPGPVARGDQPRLRPGREPDPPQVSGKTRAVVQDRLTALHSDLDSGVKASPNYTLRRAALPRSGR
jgi:hypothetical protein